MGVHLFLVSHMFLLHYKFCNDINVSTISSFIDIIQYLLLYFTIVYHRTYMTIELMKR